MKYEIGFIGAGNMGGALLAAAAKKIGGEKIAVYDKDEKKLSETCAALGCTALGSAGDIAKSCGIIMLGVKPNIIGSVAKEIAPVLAERKDNFTVVTMAAGVTIETLRSFFGEEFPIIRIMPNMPVFAGEGMILYCSSSNVPETDVSAFLEVFSEAGRFDKLDEKLIDAGTGVSGCGPAFAFMFIEALADGGVSLGLPRDAALTYAAQMLLGSAKMYLDTLEHPESLKDKVCSPGGTTIQGVRALEKGGFRSALFEAVVATYEKNSSLLK